ncbi:MAG: lactate racemase domain-containing protein [Planctomycetota bacterium]|nr:lactate racemase domain-containing protein [Planctomycetota bacterium]
MQFPQFFRVRQTFDRPHVLDIAATVDAELDKLKLAQNVLPGQSVAITAGSRGITNVRLILKCIVEHFQQLGAKPFLVPAMGSHGGGTAEGQLEVLATYGITEEYCECPIRASMETVIVCQTAEGFPVHFDKFASQADHVFVCGRVKPHTDFTGEIQSGLMKMLLIGLGKHEGAKIYHRAIHDHNFSYIVQSVANRVLSECHIVGGLAILENGYDETALLEGVLPAQFESREKELLKLAAAWLPRLPARQIDLLVVDQIGKNLSGTGMDTNIIGRKHNDHEAAPDEWPKVRRIAVRSLTEETHGNASGIGIAEFCRTAVLRQMDKRKTWMNGLTSGHISCVMTPLDFETDRELWEAALPTIGLTEPPNAKILWIKNTLELTEVECSAAFWDAFQERPDLEILTPRRDLPWDSDGNLPQFEISTPH